jgi:hypothetical protein
MTKIQPNIARSGDGAELLTVITLIWYGFAGLFYFLKPHDQIWLHIFLFGIGIFLPVETISAWRQRMQGGKVALTLSMNPVPHGMTITANFELSKLIQANAWSIEARFDESGNDYSQTVWRQTFPAKVIDGNRISAKFAFPNDYSQKNYDKLRKSKTLYQRILTLKTDKLNWAFFLDTRDADIEESILEFQTSLTLGNNKFKVENEKWRNLFRVLKIVAIPILIIVLLVQWLHIF